MRITISVPDDVLSELDQLANSMGVSRSELFVTAAREYLAKHRNEDVTAQLNEIYSQGPSGLPIELRRAQAERVDSSEW